MEIVQGSSCSSEDGLDGRAFHSLGEVCEQALEPCDLVFGVVVVRKFWQEEWRDLEEVDVGRGAQYMSTRQPLFCSDLAFPLSCRKFLPCSLSLLESALHR